MVCGCASVVRGVQDQVLDGVDVGLNFEMGCSLAKEVIAVSSPTITAQPVRCACDTHQQLSSGPLVYENHGCSILSFGQRIAYYVLAFCVIFVCVLLESITYVLGSSHVRIGRTDQRIEHP